MGTKTPASVRTNRAALRRRVSAMIRDLNAGRWDRCFARIDPRLRAADKVEQATYADQFERFRAAHGEVAPWHTRINLHLDATKNKHDPRPFAYVYIVWQDAGKGFHLFRERWVYDGGDWYTRVVGLLPAQDTPPGASAATA